MATQEHETSLVTEEEQSWKVLDQVVILRGQQNPSSVFSWKEGKFYPSLRPKDWSKFVGQSSGISLFRVEADDNKYLGFNILFRQDYDDNVIPGNYPPTEVFRWRYFARLTQFPKTLTLTQDNQCYGRHCTLSLADWTLRQEENQGKYEWSRFVFEMGYRRIRIRRDGTLVEHVGKGKDYVVLCSMP